MSLPTTPASLEMMAAKTPLIDVRAPVEFAQGSLPGAVNLPLMADRRYCLQAAGAASRYCAG